MLRSIATTLALALTVAAAPASESTYGTITGRVVGSDTKNGIAYVAVMIMDAQTGGQTDREGRFSIIHLQPGTYEMRLR
ncbi:MAG TPA: carboxypeptidase-like regulatory domain-containing protein, partial [Candidatus Eisenbacteria bacterium]|nr:carboxypeptidase-like regulatory domain-containing protein [Candidatus Eisenbacteria bacterium]